MMSSMAQAYSPHPGAMQHPGNPQGHPMVQGHPSQQGHQIPQQMQHLGVSGPGGPQVAQAGALMPGMPGVGGPSAHALQHLNPQAQMYAAQQQQMAGCKWYPFGSTRI